MGKKMIILLTVILLASALWVSQAVQAEDVQAALEKIEQAAEKITSFEADMKMSTMMMNQPMDMSGHIVVLKPDKVRMTVTMPPQGEMEMVSDGTTTWTYMPMMNLVQKMDNAAIKDMPGMRSPGQPINDPSKVLEQMNPDSLRYLGEEPVDGQPCFVFEGEVSEQVRKMGQQFIPKTMKVWLAGADGLSRKIESHAADGATMMTMIFSNVKTNIDLLEDHFTFTPPPGAQVMDMSQAIQSMMKQMQQEAPPEQ